MIFYRVSVLVLIVAIVVPNGLFDSIHPGQVSFNMRSDSGSGIIAKAKLEERRNFFHFFNVPYIICSFAAKGKWPFFPNFMQIQVDQVGRSIFTQSDSFIRNYCQKWIQVKECFRPQNIVSLPDDLAIAPPQPVQPMTEATTINTEVETFAAELRTTACTCVQRNIEPTRPGPVVFFDKNYIGNVSADTIKNTIEFLESFLPPTTKKPKRRNKVRERIQFLNKSYN